MATELRGTGATSLRTLLLAFLLAGLAMAQTVRHHRIEEQDPSFPPELTQAETAIEKKDYLAAEPLLQKVVTANPANYQAWFDLGFVYSSLGRNVDSIAAYRESVAAKSDVFESNLNLGLMLAKQGDPTAESFLRVATTLKPTANVDEGQARAWLSLAHVIEKQKPDEAVAAYQHAAALMPKDSEPHLSAGRLLESEGCFADAEAEYRQALAIDGSSTDALTGLANIYMRGQKFADAAEVLRTLITLHPDDASAHMQLGRVLAAEGKSSDALSELQTAAKLAPSDAALQRDLADVYLNNKQYVPAECAYRALLSANQNDAELHHSLGVALLHQQKLPEAEQEFLTAVKLKPDFGAAYGDLAVAANENKHYELAIKATDARARFLPEIPMSYFLRATAYDHLRNYKLASENYHKFLEVAHGEYSDQEWQARHRLIAIEPKK